MDCSNPPRDETWTEDLDWQIIHINKREKTCLIRKGDGEKQYGKSYPCILADWLIEGILLMDFVTPKYDAVSREWIVTDYRINFPVYAAIHNSYQTNYDEMITDEDGVPYE